METKYFSVTGNDYLTAKELAALVSSHYGEKAHGIIISDIPSSKATKQQPTVPIQFVWYDGHLNHVSGYEHIPTRDQCKDCTVEQIGAVLYVRSKG